MDPPDPPASDSSLRLPPSPIRFIVNPTRHSISIRSSGFTGPANLRSLRNLLMGQLIGIVRVPESYMFENSLPVVANADEIVTNVIQRCIKAGLIDTNKKRWKKFSMDPKTKFSKQGPRDNEKGIFEDFGELWNKIAGFVAEEMPKKPDGSNADPLIRFRLVPDIPGLGERAIRTKPDAILELTQTTMVGDSAEKETLGSGYCVCDAVCPFEFKPDDAESKKKDNLLKIIYNVNEFFGDDICRRAIYSFLVENTDFRILTFTRTGVIIMDPFNWIKDHQKLVRVIVSLYCATKEKLGYDPFIKRVGIDTSASSDVKESSKSSTDTSTSTSTSGPAPGDGKPLRRSSRSSVKSTRSTKSTKSTSTKSTKSTGSARKRRRVESYSRIAYEIDVGDKKYVTTGPPLSDHRADFFIGHATRVFKVHEKGDTSRVLVLKITNVSAAAASEERIEGNIIVNINRESRKLGCQRFFPTLVKHAFPKITRAENSESKADSSNLFLRDNVTALGFYPGTSWNEGETSSFRTVIGSERTESRGDIYVPVAHSTTGIPSSFLGNVETFLETRFPRRFQYRLVIEEYGRTVDKLTCLKDIFYALEQIGLALKWLHIIGYLHRDLSFGNILIVKLPDCECTEENRGYRVVLNDYDSSKEIGVLNSDSHARTGTPEFLSGELLLSQFLYTGKALVGLLNLHVDDTPSGSSVALVHGKKLLPPHPNYLHEVESLMWIAFRFMWFSVPEALVGSADQLNKQWKSGLAMFSQPQELQILQISSQRQACFTDENAFRSSFDTLPKEFQPLYIPLNKLRTHILLSYVKVETSDGFDGPATFCTEIGKRGHPSFYDAVCECFRECLDKVKSWKISTKITKLIIPEDKTPPKAVLEKANIMQDPSASTTQL